MPLAVRQSEDIEGEEVHGVAEFLQAVGTDGGLVVDELVDHAAGFEQVTDDLRGGEVVVHRVVALLAQRLDDAVGISIALSGGLYAVEVADGGEEFLQSFLGSLQCLVGEINSAAIVG